VNDRQIRLESQPHLRDGFVARRSHEPVRHELEQEKRWLIGRMKVLEDDQERLEGGFTSEHFSISSNEHTSP
jgi:hypothetical protein